MVARSSDAFVDLDTLPEDSVDVSTLLTFVLSDKASSLRGVLIEEAANAFDLLLRQALRKSYNQVFNRLPKPPSFLTGLLSPPQEIKAPFFLPTSTQITSFDSFRPVQTNLHTLIETLAPKLSREEEFYAVSLKDLVDQTLGKDASIVANGDGLTNPTAASRFLLSLVSSLDGPNSPIKLPTFLAQTSSSILSLIKPTSSKGSSTSSSGSGTSSSTNTDQEDLTKVLSVLNQLSASESSVFRATSQEILERVSDRMIGRMKTL